MFADNVDRNRPFQIDARPRSVSLSIASTALLVIDPQRDFMEHGGFGEVLGNDPEALRGIIQHSQRVLHEARRCGMTVIYTREGHLPDLSDCPNAKLDRWPEGTRIGDRGPMGRILIRGEPGHEIIPELTPLPGEIVIDKPGKDAFYHTTLESTLRSAGMTHLIVIGVTTDVCVSTTCRAANDRGFHVIVLEDCCASYDPQRHRSALDSLTAQGGIIGFESNSAALLSALATIAER